ncbi:phosphotransferase family protein [Mesobacillus foraminis]|uniref:phosphotransferase family protein n=1 Tax=Mesobacillus foraminis TaxID=279826 RepID=UPI000EF48836|nr:aminoglycoside 3'-phosphotransferase/choline kinase family protein [Mesobacillus foraminis]
MHLSKIDVQLFDLYRNQDQFWQAKLKGILSKEQLPPAPLTRCSHGSTIVYSYNKEYAIKLYPSFCKEQALRERAVLEVLSSFIECIEIPQIHSFGEYEGWKYVIMTQLNGELLADIWEGLNDKEKLTLSMDLGKVIAHIHSVPTAGLSEIDIGWKDFMLSRIKVAYEHHQRSGLKSELLEKVLAYMDPGMIEFTPVPVLLTGEYTPYNLLMNKIDGKWKLTGVIDFADCFLGDGDYDLLGPVLFMFCGDGRLVRPFLISYGKPENRLTNDFQEKLMMYALLHPYSDLNFYLSKNSSGANAENFDELAAALFPLGRTVQN